MHSSMQFTVVALKTEDIIVKLSALGNSALRHHDISTKRRRSDLKNATLCPKNLFSGNLQRNRVLLFAPAVLQSAYFEMYNLVSLSSSGAICNNML